MEPILLEKVSCILPASTEFVEVSCDLGMRSRNFGKRKMLIFDPGGQAKNKQSTIVHNKLKEMTKE